MSDTQVIYVLHFNAIIGRKRKPQRGSHTLVGIGGTLPDNDTLQAMATAYLAEIKAKSGATYTVKAREANTFTTAEGETITSYLVPMFDVQPAIVHGTL